MTVRSRHLSVLAPIALFAACNTVSSDLDKQFLTPPTAWLAEPADVGLDAEAVDIRIHSEASLTGYWIPSEKSLGTVVLFHDADVNVSALHPYYTFLHAAGFHVLALDSRGYGKSKGQPTMLSWLYDLREMTAWLKNRPEVDPKRTAYFGTGLGSVAALWAARTQGGCSALVIEHLPSPRDMLKQAQHHDGSAGSAVLLGMTEFAGLPEEIEPDENVPKLTMPALFLCGDVEVPRDRQSLLRAFGLYAGDKQLWMMAGTSGGPHGMLTHDGEYQRRIAAFLTGAFAGEPPLLHAAWRKTGDARDGQQFYEIEVTPAKPAAAAAAGTADARTAIEATAVLADGSTHAARTWLDGKAAKVRLKLPSAPVVAAAVAVPDAVADEASSFRREPTALARAAAAIDPLWERIQTLRHGTASPEDARALLRDLDALTAKEPFPPALEAELADVFALLGKELLGSSDANERASGRKLIERAIAAVPAKPELHFWAGPIATYGYPQQFTVDEVRPLLATPGK